MHLILPTASNATILANSIILQLTQLTVIIKFTVWLVGNEQVKLVESVVIW
jgi:hypothetical protein